MQMSEDVPPLPHQTQNSPFEFHAIKVTFIRDCDLSDPLNVVIPNIISPISHSFCFSPNSSANQLEHLIRSEFSIHSQFSISLAAVNNDVNFNDHLVHFCFSNPLAIELKLSPESLVSSQTAISSQNSSYQQDILPDIMILPLDPHLICSIFLSPKISHRNCFIRIGFNPCQFKAPEKSHFHPDYDNISVSTQLSSDHRHFVSSFVSSDDQQNSAFGTTPTQSEVDSNSTDDSSSNHHSNSPDDVVDKMALTPSAQEDLLINLDSSDEYFYLYSSPEIHREMLSDSPRNRAYATSFVNSSAIRNKIVLDIGTGTGFLSILCALAGAKHVYALEASPNFYQNTINIIKENNLQDKITVVAAKVEDSNVDIPTVDTIVSEWIGGLLFYERMVQSVLIGASRWLRPHGVIIPDQFQFFVQPVCIENWYSTHISFWESPICVDFVSKKMILRPIESAPSPTSDNRPTYNPNTPDNATPSPQIRSSRTSAKSSEFNIPMRSMVPVAQNQFYSRVIDVDATKLNPKYIGTVSASPIQSIQSLSLQSINPNANYAYTNFHFDSLLKTNDIMHGFLVWFSCFGTHFRLCTGPRDEPTHWGQSLLLFPPHKSEAGQIVRGHIQIDSQDVLSRTLAVSLEFAVYPKSSLSDKSSKSSLPVYTYKKVLLK